jgi:hypothetical protein
MADNSPSSWYALWQLGKLIVHRREQDRVPKVMSSCHRPMIPHDRLASNIATFQTLVNGEDGARSKLTDPNEHGPLRCCDIRVMFRSLMVWAARGKPNSMVELGAWFVKVLIGVNHSLVILCHAMLHTKVKSTFRRAHALAKLEHD